MLTVHNFHLRRHFADQRAHEYVHSPEVRREVKRQSVWLFVGFAVLIGLTLFVLWVMDKTVFVG